MLCKDSARSPFSRARVGFDACRNSAHVHFSVFWQQRRTCGVVCSGEPRYDVYSKINSGRGFERRSLKLFRGASQRADLGKRKG